jgi:hypothetical protein
MFPGDRRWSLVDDDSCPLDRDDRLGSVSFHGSYSFASSLSRRRSASILGRDELVEEPERPLPVEGVPPPGLADSGLIRSVAGPMERDTTHTGGSTMAVVLDVPAHDADQLVHRWGAAVALQMLNEGAISPDDFLCLCAEAADAAESC